MIGFQVAKDSSVEKLIDKIKNWYFEKEGKHKAALLDSCRNDTEIIIFPLEFSL